MTITEDFAHAALCGAWRRLGLRGALSCCRKPQRCGGTDFPWHMIAVNTLGCILVGFFVAVLYVKLPHPRWINLFYWGFIGGFTAFSSFIKEECIFSCMGSILRDSFIFSCRTCLACLLPVPLLVGQDAALRMTAAPL